VDEINMAHKKWFHYLLIRKYLFPDESDQVSAFSLKKKYNENNKLVDCGMPTAESTIRKSSISGWKLAIIIPDQHL
jgi:hypothetical protein